MSAPLATQPRPGAELWQRLRTGEMSALPIAGALVLIWIVFQALNGSFLSSDNLVNLTQQSAATGVIALGVVLTLHLGQIDLSVGAVSGLAAAIVAVGSVRIGWPLTLAVVAALAAGVLIGLLYGAVHTRLGVPSFVFTLAGLLVVGGLQLRVLGSTGSVNLPFQSWLVRFCQTSFLPSALSWLVVAGVVAVFAGARLRDRARRLHAELSAPSLASVLVRVGVLAAILAAAVAYLGTNRGVGSVFALFVGLVALTDLALRRTRWGRFVRAVGGDAEAARRAGVPVRRVLVSVFAACSTLAALGGVLAVGRLAAANQASGAVDVTLTAVAAAVIGGTSMYGGRGSAWSALLGILIIQSISTGLTLLNMDQSVRYVVTGLVLAIAVVIDALQRRAREQ
ncbi:sugar ABC transporter permease [Cellulomonas sp. PhB150]|uniref:sugar ABC transporter permease n=1 Tax=Cellulomonas sp. PhB150 TaxID=2485188 RepID=UPI000F4AC2D9|nr:sugar ABC transporter permease [Cellulomonas sp. PhB150]ROS31396.1 simple sugar transport system permease protein/D-xylose transport system permease protein [Cellulomonas sp. PhB150]